MSTERMDELWKNVADSMSARGWQAVRAMIEEAVRRTTEKEVMPDGPDGTPAVRSADVTEGERCVCGHRRDQHNRLAFECRMRCECSAFVRAAFDRVHQAMANPDSPTDVPDPPEDPDVLSDWVLQCSECGHVGRVRRLRRDPNTDVPEAPVWFDPPTDDIATVTGHPYSGMVARTAEGDEVLYFCFRDDTVELRVPGGPWYRADQDGKRIVAIQSGMLHRPPTDTDVVERLEGWVSRPHVAEARNHPSRVIAFQTARPRPEAPDWVEATLTIGRSPDPDPPTDTDLVERVARWRFDNDWKQASPREHVPWHDTSESFRESQRRWARRLLTDCGLLPDTEV